MDLDSYVENFSWFVISYDTHDWYQDYYLKLDDNDDSNIWQGHWCDGCVEKTLVVESAINQTVHVGAHLYETRAYGDHTSDTRDCSKKPKAWVFEQHDSLYPEN